MIALLSLLLPALTPAISDGVRGLIGKFTGGATAQPQNVAEAIQLMQAETEKLKALAELDRPSGEISRWVSDLRASFRYLAAGVVILVASALLFVPGIDQSYVDMAWSGAQSVWAFIFGDRMYAYIRKK